MGGSGKTGSTSDSGGFDCSKYITGFMGNNGDKKKKITLIGKTRIKLVITFHRSFSPEDLSRLTIFRYLKTRNNLRNAFAFHLYSLCF